MHKEQRVFVKGVKKKYPWYFEKTKVIDVGSLDINGNNRYLFKGSSYLGIDIVAGKNVDLVGPAHEALIKCPPVDVVISTECLEHDKDWKLTLQAMYHSLRRGGLMIMTCAGMGREEHGTNDHHPWCSPGTNDYYENRSVFDIANILPMAHLFQAYHLEQNKLDIQFYGIKQTQNTYTPSV